MGGNISEKLALIVGAIACVIGIVAIGLGAYAVHNITSTSGSITTGAVRSSTFTVNDEPVTSSNGGSTVTTVLQTGTYNVTMRYLIASQPAVQQLDTKPAGTYVLRSIVLNGAVSMLYMELTPFSYTFQPTEATLQPNVFLDGFSPTFLYASVPLLGPCTPYTVTTSMVNGPYNSISPFLGAGGAYSVALGTGTFPTIATRFDLTLDQSIRYIFGSVIV